MNLFLFAHQDDEYGVFPVLEKLVAQGEAVSVVYLTSGTLDGQPSERRNQESIGVLGRIGVTERNIHFAGTDHGSERPGHRCIHDLSRHAMAPALRRNTTR